MKETWLSAQGDEAKTVESATSGFDVKSFPRQSRSRGGGIATVYKSTLEHNITFKTNFDLTHTSLEVLQASKNTFFFMLLSHVELDPIHFKHLIECLDSILPSL